MDRQTSEMEQLKEDWDKSEKEHEKAFKSIIVSEETLCGSIEEEWCVMALCCGLDTHRIQRQNTTVQLLFTRLRFIHLPLAVLTVGFVSIEDE